MTDPARITVCIPCLNSHPFHILAVKSARRFIPGCQIWANDAGSVDATHSFITKHCDKATSRPGSHGTQIDSWTLEVQTEFFVMLDSDAEVVAFDSLDQAVSMMDSDPALAAVDGTRFEVGGLPVTDPATGDECVQQTRIDPSYCLVHTSHAKKAMEAGYSWRRKRIGSKWYDDAGWMREGLLSLGFKTSHSSQMMEGYVHYGNVGWARNPAAPFEALQRYVRNRELVERKLSLYA